MPNRKIKAGLPRLAAGFWVLVSVMAGASSAAEPIRLATTPALSPDGSTLAFSWGGDLWTVSSQGGKARPLTRNASIDRDPEFSPDGSKIAFASDRLGSPHLYVMPAEGGAPKQVGFHSGGYTPQGWTADGRSILVQAQRDHYWRDSDRFFLIHADERSAEIPLFDAAGTNGSLSPDGKKLLFTREGPQWWRKGYKGSQASQVWMYDLESKAFTKILDPSGGALSPLWRPDGQAFYYVGVHKGSFNLLEHVLKDGKDDRPLSEFADDSVVQPCISRDGKTIVFRHLFDLYRVNPTEAKPPTRLEIVDDGDTLREPNDRRTLTEASQAAFTKDGLEVAFIAGGDLWVMDTELKEPRQVTATPEEERDPVFSPNGDAIYFVSDKGGQSDVWKADRADASKDWWLNSSFKLDQLTHDVEVEEDLQFSPDGSRLAFIRGRGDLWVIGPDGKDPKKLISSWNAPRFDWSPDGKWIVYAQEDEDFNSDIYIAPLDGSKPPFNLSRHPDNEGEPVWSPDGKVIAFTGRRVDTEVDIYFVYLRAEEDDKTSRERTLEKAIEKMKARKSRSKAGRPGDAVAKGDAPQRKGEATKKDEEKPKEEGSKPAEEAAKALPTVVIDFDRIEERIRRVEIPDSSESGLFWSPDSKKLAFSGSVEGKDGLYTIEFPDDLKPKLVSTQVGRGARWLESGNQIVWVSGGVPAKMTPGGVETPYRFRATQDYRRADKYRAVFDLAWRLMRDNFYDENLGNRNWDAVRRKYADAAAQAPDPETLAVVVNLMLGELNGSHLGFSLRTAGGGPGGGGGRPRRGAPTVPIDAGRPTIATAHLGIRFEPDHKGPGLKVRDVVPGSPADKKANRVIPGELVIAIDGTSVDPAMDLTKVLNGPTDRDVRLTVRASDGKEREVVLRPISYVAARLLLYDKWVKDNRKKVEELSKGKLGYLHIRSMDFPSFYKFEEELYSAGAGKDGLIIDVRENGGGSTTDHLLTVLTQPTHAIAVPRGGGPGYPQDRRVYATWSKPIVVLCNQNSFSNAEIFSHAVKTLKRGKLVGAPTAGGVIGTGAAAVMDVGTLRMPTRGWFLINDGEDMELNGAVPDVVVWPDPADFAKGVDAQLAKGVEVLEDEVKEAAKRPRPKLRKATQRAETKPAAQ